MNRAQRTLLAASIFALAATAQAGIMTYNTQAAFLAAISAPGVDDYDDLTAGAAGPASYNRATQGNVYNYRATASHPTVSTTFYNAGGPVDTWLSTNGASDTITFDQFSADVIGVGGFFFASDVSGAAISETVTVTADDGTTVSVVLTNTTTGTFVGFTTDSSFASIEVFGSLPEDTTGIRWPTVNDLTLGVAPDIDPPGVPEPATLALLGLGLAGLAASRRRKLQ